MCFFSFQRFPPLLQLAYVLRHGLFLAQRWDGNDIHLFYCEDEGRGFFVEVAIGDSRGQAVVLRSFVNSEPLGAYAREV